MVIFDWHGYRAALDKDGRPEYPPRGIEAELRARVTHLGVPMHHEATGKHIKAMISNGFRLVRTLEPPWNAGREDEKGEYQDLGRILAEFESVENPGSFFQRFVDNLQGPCQGVGWNMEHDTRAIPLSEAEVTIFQRVFGAPTLDGFKQAAVAFRCMEFALVAKIYLALARKKFGASVDMFCYSGYGGVKYNRLSLADAYSVDWGTLSRPGTWKSTPLLPITHAVCASCDLHLPAIARAAGLPVLHVLGLPEYADDEQRWDDYRTVARDRAERVRARACDGLALVACSPLSGPWNHQEDRLRTILAGAQG